MSDLVPQLERYALGWLSNAYVVGIHVTLFVAGVALPAVAARRASPSLRATLWALATVGPVVVTVLCYLPLGWWAPVLTGAPAAPVLAAGALILGAESGRAPVAASVVGILYLVWLLGVAATLGGVARAWLRMTRITREAAPVSDRDWDRLLREAANALDVPVDVELRRTTQVASPVVWGVLDPVLLLPADADAWPTEQRRAVLLHELAHVRRGDCAVQLLAQVACAWYWPHPALWWAAAQLRQAREEACDRMVVDAGVRASDYAGFLLSIADAPRTRDARHSASMAMARPARLHVRIRSLLAGAHRAGKSERRARVVTLWLAGAWMLLLGSVRLSVARPDLWQALASDHGGVRAYAALVLAHSRDDRVRDAAIRRAGTDPDPLVRRTAGASR